MYTTYSDGTAALLLICYHLREIEKEKERKREREKERERERARPDSHRESERDLIVSRQLPFPIYQMFESVLAGWQILYACLIY
jgi:hypothetical protein